MCLCFLEYSASIYCHVNKFGNYIEKDKDREKEKVGERPEKLNEKKSDRELEQEIKKSKGDKFCWKNNTKIL